MPCVENQILMAYLQVMVVAPRLRCGLGNRLFQMVAAIGEAERTDTTPVFFLPRMSHSDHGNFQLLLTLFPKIKLLQTAPAWLEVEEKDLPTKIGGPLVVLSGFFQDTRFFPKPDNPYMPRLPTIHPRGAWAIHFRFGDYQILKHYHVDLARYYFYTVSKIPKGETLVLFSDSPERLKPIQEELSTLGYKVEIFNNPDTLESLKAFASCVKGSICSNSTFAWWAAYFAWVQSKGYKAYFPNRWIVNTPPPNLNYSFTQFINIDEIVCPPLLSFSHS